MKGWKVAAFVALLIVAGSVGAAIVPPVHGQTRVRTQSPVIQILTGGSRIGVTVRDVDDAGAKEKGAASGVVVEEVAADSPAEKAGLRKGDAILEFDGERVRSVRQLTRLVHETPSGRTVQAAVLRDGQRTVVSITPSESERFSFERFDDIGDWARGFAYQVAPRPPAAPAPPSRVTPPSPPSPPPPPAWGFNDFGDLLGRTSGRLGIGVGTLSPQLAEYFGAKRGVLVTSVTDGSAAAKAGVKAGDVITSINGSEIDEPSDLRRRAQDLRDGDQFTIEVMRDRKTLTLKGTAATIERRRTATTIL
jgi:serine protease Do